MPLFPYSYEISNGCKPKTTNANYGNLWKVCIKVVSGFLDHWQE